MACPLKPEQQKALYISVLKGLGEIKSKNEKFSARDYIGSIHDMVYNAKKDPAQADLISQSVPDFIKAVTTDDQELSDYLTDNGLDLNEINTLSKNFRKNINNVTRYLGPVIDVQKNIELNQQATNLHQTESVNPPDILPEKELVPSDWLTDTGQQAAHRSISRIMHEDGVGKTEALAIQRAEVKRNIPEPQMAFYYNFKRDVINKLNRDPSFKGDSRNMTPALYYTAMSAARIPASQLNKHDTEFLTYGTDRDKAAAREAFNNQIVMVITDKDGNPLHFDEDLLPSSAGRMVYSIGRTVYRTADKKIDYERSGIQSPEATAKSLGISLEEATARQETLAAQLTNVNKYIKANPNNQVVGFITGGNQGIIGHDNKKRVEFSSIKFDDGTVIGLASKEAGKWQNPVINLPGVSEEHLPKFNTNEISKTDAEKLASLLVDDVYRGKDKISPSEKFEILTSFVLTREDRVEYFPTTGAIRIRGKILDTVDKENARKELTKAFLSPIIGKAAKAMDKVPGNYTGKIWKLSDPDITDAKVPFIIQEKDKFYWGNFQIYNVRDKMTTINDFSIEKDEAGRVTIKDNPTGYIDWMKSRAYTYSQPNAEGKLVPMNGYFKFAFENKQLQLTDGTTEEIKKADAIPLLKPQDDISGPIDSPKENIPNIIKRLANQKRFKSYYQKESNTKAVEDQIVAAKAWYQDHPMAKHLPFTEMFNIVNSNNPEGVAQWTVSGITLFKGADYTDLYHEAWHGFTQMFLTKEEKQKLYNDTRKLSGTFTDYRGNRVEFSKGSDYQLEEWLAEDFRSFMLTGKIKNETPVRKSIFQKIWNLLKALFGNTTAAEVALNDRGIKSINELYTRLRVGNINEMTFNQANRNFHILNKGLVKLKPVKGELESLGYADSRLVVNSLDSIVTDIAVDWGLSEDAFVSEYDLMKDPEARLAVYDEIFTRIKKMRLQAEERFQNATPDTQMALKYNLELLSTIEENMGRPSDPKMQGLNRGVIAYHLRNTRFLTREDAEQVFDEAEEGKYIKDREGFKRSGNETALEHLAAPEIVSLLRSIYKPSNQRNRLGIREYMEDRDVINIISKYLIGDSDREVIYNKLRKKAENLKDDQQDLYKQLIIRLGNPLSPNAKTQDIWRKFQQLLDKVNRQLQQLTIDRNTGTGAHYIYFGVSSGKHQSVERVWKNSFITMNSPFMTKDKEGIYLDLNKLVEYYGEKLPESKYLEFLRNIGVNLYRTDKGESEEVIHSMFEDKGKKGRYAINQIYNSIKELKAADITRITSLDELSKERPKITKGWTGRLTNLAKLEAEVNPRIGHMVTNASGSTQYEISLPSSNSRVISAFNNANSKQELFDPSGRFRYMSHLNPEFNPFTRNSIWIDSVFDKDTGAKIGHLNTFNASGISLIENSEEFVSGAALADVDYVSKLLGDMFIFLQSGHTEGTRTSDRGTTYLQHPAFIKNPGTHQHSGKFYIDPAYFLTRSGETESIGRNTAKKIFIQKIANELARINYMKNLPANSEEHNKLVSSGERYSDKGKEFVIFDDVLKKTTKDQLKAIDTTEDLQAYLEKNNPELLKAINADLDTYYETLRDNFIKRFRDIKYDPATLLKSFVGTENLNEGKKEIARRYSIYASSQDGLFTNDQYTSAITEAYLVNQWIHNYEEMSIFNGDLALYKGAIDYVKRITGGPSTGTGFLNDRATIKYLNDKGTDPNDPKQDLRPYINSKWFKGNKPKSIAIDGTLHTAVMQDPVLKSIYSNQYADALRSDLEPRLKKSGKYTQSEIDKILDKEIEAYLKIKATDGQGYIAFDTYRILRILNGEWEPQDEKLYKQIIHGERIRPEDSNRFFQVLKLQYYGPLAVKGIPVQGFHKFSLLPLIPTLVKGTPLEHLHNKMVEQGIDYSLFATGSKIASIGTDGENDKFYATKDNKSLAFTSPDYKFTDNPIYIEFLKDQMAVPNEYKGKSTFSTQLRRLITTGLLSEGVPVTPEKGVLYKNYVNAVKTLTEEKKKELGFEITDKNGNLSLEKFVAVAKNELDRRDLGEHEKNFLDAFSNGELKHDLSLSPSSEVLEKIFVGIIEKRLVRQKFNGEGLVQVSSVGLQNVQEAAVTEADMDEMIKSGEITEDCPPGKGFSIKRNK